MTLCILMRQDGNLRARARPLFLAFLLLSTVAWSPEAASPSASDAAAAALKRNSALCHAHADLDACYDAIRWNPGDPALLVALGDALVLAQRPVDAIRIYHRAAALAPRMPGITAKIRVAEARLTSKRAAGNLAPGKRYTNAAPEAQSH